MPAIDFDTERTSDSERFAAREVFRTDRSRVVRGCFDPDRFIPVHAPGNDVGGGVRDGAGIVREGDADHRVDPGDAVAVGADTPWGIRADGDGRLGALLVTAPPPSDADHEPVRRGIRQGEFEPPTDS